MPPLNALRFQVRLLRHVRSTVACRPDGPCPIPARIYPCPLCKESVDHDISRPDDFPFEPQIDMHPGHLACKHCHASFSMEIELRTHFQRPVLLCTWTSHQHFGKPFDSSCPQENQSMSDARNLILHRWCPGLSIPENMSNWIPEAAQALIHTPRHDMKSMVPFDPEAKLKWFHDTLTQIAPHPDMPLSNLPPDSVFSLAYLHELHPLSWAWHSMEPTPTDVLPINMPEYLRDQLTDLHSALHSIEHAPAQDWTLWYQSNRYDGRGDARRRSEFFRFVGGLQSTHRQSRQKTAHGDIQWPEQTWPGFNASILALLGLNVEWRQRRATEYDCKIVSQAGGCPSSIGIGQELHVLPPMRSKKHHAQHVGQGQGLECPQTKWRRICPIEVDSFPTLLPGVGPKNSQVEFGGKRRRLDSEPQEPRNLYRRIEVGLLVVGSSGSDAETQQDSTFDLGENQDVIGTDCTP